MLLNLHFYKPRQTVWRDVRPHTGSLCLGCVWLGGVLGRLWLWSRLCCSRLWCRCCGPWLRRLLEGLRSRLWSLWLCWWCEISTWSLKVKMPSFIPNEKFPALVAQPAKNIGYKTNVNFLSILRILCKSPIYFVLILHWCKWVGFVNTH